MTVIEMRMNIANQVETGKNAREMKEEHTIG
jgi:hypothetical protein